VLHTWSQTLIDHFHLHCLIPGGVLAFTKDKWLPASESFLFRVESLAKEFRKRYLRKLGNAYRKDRINVPQAIAFQDMIHCPLHTARLLLPIGTRKERLSR
jgi:hypothetical protein